MLRINRCGHRRAVAQNVADLSQRSTLSQHVGGQAMPENVATDIGLWWTDTGCVISIPQYPAQDLGILESLERRFDGDEQRPVRPPAFILDVINYRLANLHWQWHPVVQLSFAPDQDFAGTPVDVVQLYRRHFRCPKTEPGDQHQHRIVASACFLVVAHHLDETIDLFRLKIPRNAGWFGLARLWYGSAQVALGFATPEQELEQVAKMRRAGLVTRRVLRLSQSKYEARDIVGHDSIEVAQTGAELRGQEAVLKPQAVIDGVLGQAALDAEIGFVFPF